MGELIPGDGKGIQVKGRPERLDAVLRPFSFVALGGMGLIGSAVLGWLGWWFWLPVPVAAGLLLHGIIFRIRGDRPILLRLQDGRLTSDDDKVGHHHELDLARVHTAGLSVRKAERSEQDVAYLSMHDERGEPLLALRLICPRRAWPLHAADLDAVQPLLGGNAGVLRGMAPPKRIVRQLLSDSDGSLAAALLEQIPEAAFSRRALRVWRGEAPPVDFMGLHQGPPDGFLVLEDSPNGPVVHVFSGSGPAALPDATVPLDATRGGRAARILSLLSLPGQDDRLARLPVLVWTLGEGLPLAMPAPIAGHLGDEVELDEHALHTHLAEGAGAVWWLLQHLDLVPDNVIQAISDARVVTPQLHPTLARHLPPA